MNTENFLDVFKQIGEAPDAVDSMRRFVIDLAVRGKLVAQEPADGSALDLLQNISVPCSAQDEVRGHSDNYPHELPHNWHWTSIGTIFNYDAGKKRKPQDLDSSMWLLELEDIEKDSGNLLQFVRAGERSSKSTKSEFEQGDVLYGKLRPYLNKVLVAHCGGYSTTEIVALRPKIPMDSNYCALALRRPDFVDYVTRLGQGTKMPRLRKNDALSAWFPLPPLAEQQRIVAEVNKLMALFDQLEEAYARRETTRIDFAISSCRRLSLPHIEEIQYFDYSKFVIDNLKNMTVCVSQIMQLRRTILNLAVRGKLVAQEPADGSALDLLQNISVPCSAQDEVRGHSDNYPHELPHNWHWTSIGTIFNYDAGKKRKPQDLDSSMWLLELEDIEKDSGNLLQFVRAGERSSKSTKSEFEQGDVLYGKLRPYLNKVLVAHCGGYSTTEIVALRPKIPMDSNYCALALRRPDFVDYVTRLGQGTKMPRLRKNDALSAWFPLPPLAEQQRIVAEVNKLMALFDQIEEAINNIGLIKSDLVKASLHAMYN